MTQADFPFLTPEILEAQGESLIDYLAKLWPEALSTLIPLMDHIPLVRTAIQTACDEWNRITGAKPTS